MLNLLNFTRQELKSHLENLGEKPFHGEQIFKWIHHDGVTQFDDMTNLSLKLRDKLKKTAHVCAPTLALEKISSDGTIKWLLKLSDNNCIETVFIPEVSRGTLCISSQVGCALTCSFCSTAKQGFSRNLEVFEIIGQLWFAVRRLSKMSGKHDKTITNVVFMGMGEPLLNFKSVQSALDIMLDDLGYGLSKYRVTVSTSGVVPMMEKLRDVSPASLAVSLHAPNDELRNILVPINKKYPLKQLIAVCKDYFQKRGESKREIVMEYVMLNHFNDKPEDAKQLAELLKNIPVKINLIPFNPFPQTTYQRSTPERIEAFKQILKKANYNVTVRKTRGDGIDAACGQLVGKFEDETNRKARLEKYFRRISIPVVESKNHNTVIHQ